MAEQQQQQQQHFFSFFSFKMKENKFVMGEDETTKSSEPMSASLSAVTAVTSTPHHKRPVKHHVKRRSSSRVHVAKLAPMARANSSIHTDTEADYFDESSTPTEHNRPAMKRSQSQRSLHRLSVDRKGMSNFTAATTTTAAAVQRKPTATSNDKSNVSRMISTTCKDQKIPSSNPAPVSSSSIAAPVEITFNAVANNLVIPKKEHLPKIASPLKSSAFSNSAAATAAAAAAAAAGLSINASDTQQQCNKKQLLRSQFIIASSYEEPTTSYKRCSATSSIAAIPFNHSRPTSSSCSSSTNPSRTQQKLLLQKQQALVQDENSPVHPRNMHKLNREFDMVAREYRCIKRHDNPMRASLLRCLHRHYDSNKATAEAAAAPVHHPQLARLQLGANRHSMSSSIVPTISTVAPVAAATATTNALIPHLEQRQIAHRHHHLKSVALSRSSANKRQLHQNLCPTAYKNLENDKNKQTSHSAFPWNAAAFIDRLFGSTPH